MRAFDRLPHILFCAGQNKKVKMVCHPCKIFKRTALIMNMLTSDLEKGRFEGAAVCLSVGSGGR